MSFSLGEDTLSCAKLAALASKPNPELTVSKKARERLLKFRGYVDSALESGNKIYGINTGFGYLSDVSIEKNKLKKLQINLIRSHACAVGNPTPIEVVRGMLILRAHTFLIGHSAVTEECLDTILQLIKHDI